MTDTPSTPSTPQNIRRPKELPLDSDVEDPLLTPLELPSARGGLLDFPSEEFADLTPAQLYEMNQQLLNDSVPTRPLIDSISPMAALRSEYENGSLSFVKQIDWLSDHGFDRVRRTKALGFAYIESLITSSEREFSVASSLSILSGTRETLDSAGIEKLVYEDFYDDFTSLIESIIKPNSDGLTLDSDGLLKSFQTPEVSNSVVIYLRFLTSAQIRLNREDYEGFLVHPDTKDLMDVDSFCANVVQAMGKEADNVEIQALCRALQLNVDLAYLNGVREDGVDFIKFRYDSSQDAPPLVLLYRPGHYDILVKKTDQ
ncbi:OVARIAN TUMOR DOMAIN-containing deubiquitinating enzyme 1 [Psilocybe cubensis]|uniref:OVARIAN TUMOR DOMAIN-containing deubiquitinating enzyme 1 n=1 Tax=Psilocybe cubensis TaxID=181762 RepID=A0ACB8GN43_PSICU|nr:OVARIAN TUMOR DOMAIN-containing deubiquitinating enzyme 1 [Psilocybe cubensis]KAH9477068.1 OVARIAN TUMOR DOMAIN-containing deubiquitinating enzyme 1 [Psilocybe cubensis]